LPKADCASCSVSGSGATETGGEFELLIGMQLLSRSNLCTPGKRAGALVWMNSEKTTVRTLSVALRLWIVAAGTLALALAASFGPAAAHPHVWVTVETTVVYDGGKITGLQHKWTFDDSYTEMAIEGLDANKDGQYSREELAELAKVNIDGLKEFGYFTVAKLGETRVKAKDPVDYHLEYKDGFLSLFFMLPFEQPVLADAQNFNFTVFDESFFIAFDFGTDNPVKLSAGAPAGCSAQVGIPENELEKLKALNESFGGQLTAGDANAGMGGGYAKTVTLGCKKS
jgi:ABC-type uncharacterized transport system substrate-binding protein